MKSLIKFLLFALILSAVHTGWSQNKLEPITRPSPLPVCVLPVECWRLDRAQRAETELPLVKAQLNEALKALETSQKINVLKDGQYNDLQTQNQALQSETQEIKTELKLIKKRRWIAPLATLIFGLLL